MVDTQLDLQRALLRIADGRYWSRLLQPQQQCDVELLQALLQYEFWSFSGFRMALVWIVPDLCSADDFCCAKTNCEDSSKQFCNPFKMNWPALGSYLKSILQPKISMVPSLFRRCKGFQSSSIAPASNGPRRATEHQFTCTSIKNKWTLITNEINLTKGTLHKDQNIFKKVSTWITLQNRKE